MITYTLNKETKVLTIKNGVREIAQIENVNYNLEKSEIEYIVENTLDDMGYNWLKNGEIEVKPMKLGKVEYKNGISKNIAGKDYIFVSKWNTLLRFLKKDNGGILSIREVSNSTFDVIFNSLPNQIHRYKVYKNSPSKYVFSMLINGYYIWVSDVIYKD